MQMVLSFLFLRTFALLMPLFLRTYASLNDCGQLRPQFNIVVQSVLSKIII